MPPSPTEPPHPSPRTASRSEEAPNSFGTPAHPWEPDGAHAGSTTTAARVGPQRTAEGSAPGGAGDGGSAASAPHREAPAPSAEPQSVADAERRYWLRLIPVLAVVTVVTRLPSFARPLWNPDEGFVATQARQLADGGTLYDTVVDRKPPLLPWLYQGAFALFGDDSLWPLRVLAIGAVLTAAVLIASIARRRWGDGAGWSAGVAFVLILVGLSPEDTQAASFGLFMVVWTVAAMWFADRERWCWAGIALAGAMLTKQTGGAVLLPLLFVLWRSRAGWLALGWLLAGAVLPLAAVALAFGPADFVYWTATGSGAYTSVKGAGVLALLRALGGTGLLTLACLPLLCVLVFTVATRREVLARTADLWVWLVSSAAAVTVGFQFFGHYFLQLVPALALLSAGALCGVGARGASVAVALTALIAAGYTGWGYLADRQDLDHAHRVAHTVRDRTDPGDRVLFWGMHPEHYWISDRVPASRYLTAGFLTNYSGGRGGVRVGERFAMDGAWTYFMGELRQRPPEMVVDDARGKPYGARHIPTLRAFLDRHYERTGSVGGAILYTRTAPQPPSPPRPGIAPLSDRPVGEKPGFPSVAPARNP